MPGSITFSSFFLFLCLLLPLPFLDQLSSSLPQFRYPLPIFCFITSTVVYYLRCHSTSPHHCSISVIDLSVQCEWITNFPFLVRFFSLFPGVFVFLKIVVLMFFLVTLIYFEYLLLYCFFVMWTEYQTRFSHPPLPFPPFLSLFLPSFFSRIFRWIER